MSENKTAKYFKYAIGEIILVVIGILIAVQINNWNEERKQENKGKEYIGEIYRDLQNDISNIEQILSELRVQYAATENLLSYFETETKKIVDTIQFTKDHWAPARLFIVQRDQNTFDNLKGTVLGSLIKNDTLPNLLDRFYKNFDIRVTNFKEYPQQIRMDLRKVSFPIGNMEDFKYEIETDKLSATFIKEYLSNENVYDHLLSIFKTCRYNIRFFGELLDEALSLTEYIDTQYPEHK